MTIWCNLLYKMPCLDLINMDLWTNFTVRLSFDMSLFLTEFQIILEVSRSSSYIACLSHMSSSDLKLPTIPIYLKISLIYTNYSMSVFYEIALFPRNTFLVFKSLQLLFDHLKDNVRPVKSALDNYLKMRWFFWAMWHLFVFSLFFGPLWAFLFFLRLVRLIWTRLCLVCRDFPRPYLTQISSASVN